MEHIQQKRVRGEYTIEHMRPRQDAESQSQFWPLWDERNAVKEKIASLETKLESMTLALVAKDSANGPSVDAPVPALMALLDSLSKPKDILATSAGYRATVAELTELQAKEQELTAKLRPFQEVLHSERFDNVVTDVGARDMLDKYFKGSAYTQTMRMGLKGTGTAVVGDTQSSHAGWLEQGLANAPTYTGNRPSQTFNSASGSGAGSRSSATPTQAFAITSSGTVHGCFINNGGSATKDDTTGILFSAGDFTGGSRAVINGDTLNVTYTLSL